MKYPIGHIEIPSKDLERSKNFYSSLFGWKFKPYDSDYWFFSTGVEPGGGIMKSEEVGKMTNYITVQNMETFLEAIPKLGGNVLKGKTEIPNMGWYALAQDPDGNPFGLYEGLPKKPKKRVKPKKRRK